MCTYRSVFRSLITTAAILTACTAASAQPTSTRVEADGKIEILTAGDAVVWRYEDAHRSTVYSARAPDYRPTRLSSRVVGEGETSRRATGSISPDGDWILYLRDGLLYRLPAEAELGAEESSRGVPVFETTGVVTDAAWSPDGSRIAFVMAAPKARWLPKDASTGVPSFVGIFDLESGRRWFLSPSRERDGSPVWTPDGSEIFFQRRSSGASGASMTAPRSDSRSISVEAEALRSTSSLMVGDVESGEIRVLWTDAEDALVLICPGGSAREVARSAGPVVAPPLAGGTNVLGRSR